MCGAATSCLLALRRRDGSAMWRRAIAIDSTFITLWLRCHSLAWARLQEWRQKVGARPCADGVLTRGTFFSCQTGGLCCYSANRGTATLDPYIVYPVEVCGLDRSLPTASLAVFEILAIVKMCRFSSTFLLALLNLCYHFSIYMLLAPSLTANSFIIQRVLATNANVATK